MKRHGFDHHEGLGFGPWPLARFQVAQMIRDQQRQRRIERVHPMELNYAI